MASATHNLGDYTIEDDGNGDYVLKEPNGNIILRWDDSTGDWYINDSAGNAVIKYDDSAGEISINSNTLVGISALAGLSTNNVSNLEGDNLAVDGSGNLDATHIDVSDDGTTVVASSEDVNFVTGLNVTDDGDGTVSVDLSEEQVDDFVNNLLAGGTNVTLTYDDAGNTLTIDATDTRTDASDDGTTVVSDITDVNFGTDLAVTDDGDGTVTVDSTVTSSINGSYDTVTTVTANYTAQDREIVLADASGGDVTVTLPSPTEALLVTVKKISGSGNDVIIATPGSETIDGNSTETINSEDAAREVTSDGADYFII